MRTGSLVALVVVLVLAATLAMSGLSGDRQEDEAPAAARSPAAPFAASPPASPTSRGSSTRGPDWDSSAIFITWDDWGGFYDHVVPPLADENGYGLRVRGLLVSPYARRGFVDHQTLTFDAYLKLIEDRFLDGQRLDPCTDGRPDARPSCARPCRSSGTSRWRSTSTARRGRRSCSIRRLEEASQRLREGDLAQEDIPVTGIELTLERTMRGSGHVRSSRSHGEPVHLVEVGGSELERPQLDAFRLISADEPVGLSEQLLIR